MWLEALLVASYFNRETILKSATCTDFNWNKYNTHTLPPPHPPPKTKMLPLPMYTLMLGLVNHIWITNLETVALLRLALPLAFCLTFFLSGMRHVFFQHLFMTWNSHDFQSSKL